MTQCTSTTVLHSVEICVILTGTDQRANAFVMFYPISMNSEALIYNSPPSELPTTSTCYRIYIPGYNKTTRVVLPCLYDTSIFTKNAPKTSSRRVVRNANNNEIDPVPAKE